MDQDTLFLLLLAAVSVSAVAIVLQLIVLIAFYRTSQAASEKTAQMAEQAKEIMNRVQADLSPLVRRITEAAGRVAETVHKAGALVDSARVKVEQFDVAGLKAEWEAGLQEVRQQVQATAERLDAAAARISHLLEVVEAGWGQASETLGAISTTAGKATVAAQRSVELVESAKSVVTRVDGLLGDATSRARLQLDRVQMAVDTTIDRFEQVSVSLDRGILQPVRQVNGVLAGVQAAIAHLLRGKRTSVAQATHDEEMFI